MTEPIFEPRTTPDLTDVNLPRHCTCGAWLPREWGTEEDDGELVAYVECKRCHAMSTKVIAKRGQR